VFRRGIETDVRDVPKREIFPNRGALAASRTGDDERRRRCDGSVDTRI
jgi:hypothetical protein